MVLVQSCIDNIGLLKKAASLFISLALVFPLGFWRREKTQQTVSINRKAVQGREQGLERLSWCCRRREAEDWPKCPFGEEGAPTPVTSSFVASRSFQSCPSSGKSLGACEGQRVKIRDQIIGEHNHKEEGVCHLFFAVMKRGEGAPTPDF